jgi:hypothetical protein
MAVVDQLLRIFAGSILAKARALKTLELNRKQRTGLRETITAEIRACGRLLYPEVAEASEAAIREAAGRGVNLWVHTWRTQRKFDPDRAVFHWEHVNPIACIQKRCEAAESEEEILDALAGLRIAWILKREDQQLNRLGFRSNRPDPEAAYRAAGIVLVQQCEG